MVTPPIAPQGSPIVDVVGISTKWSPIKLNGPKEVWKQPFQMKIHLNCENDEVQVNHLEIIHHLLEFQSHL